MSLTPEGGWVIGDTTPVFVTIATAKAAVIGNIVGMSAGTLVNASDTAWDTNLATTQTAFTLLFIGRCAQRKDANVARIQGNKADNEIRVDTTGVFEYTCASASFAVGDLVGMAKASGNALEDQKVVSVATEALSIGRVWEATASSTTVRVKLHSKLMPSARQAP